MNVNKAQNYLSLKVINFMENHPTQSFDKREVNLLNYFLNFGIPDPRNAFEDDMGHVESSIENMLK